MERQQSKICRQCQVIHGKFVELNSFLFYKNRSPRFLLRTPEKKDQDQLTKAKVRERKETIKIRSKSIKQGIGKKQINEAERQFCGEDQ